MKSICIVEEFKNHIKKNEYKLVERSNLVSPYFKGQFNLSGAHNHLIPAIQNKNKINIDRIGVVDLVVRDVDSKIIGTSNSHLLLFEMGVFGSFGFAPNLESEIRLQLQVLNNFFTKVGINTSDVYTTICGGGEYLGEKIEFDNMSYNALIHVGFDRNKIISTKGRRNFMLSRGIDRLAGYNIEFFVEHNKEFIEIASSNIYKYLNKLTHLEKTINSGVGCGVGFERLSLILSNKNEIYEISPYDELISIIKKFFTSSIDFELIKHKIYRTIECIKSIIFILNDGVIYDNSPQGKKLKKYTSKVKSELNYIEFDSHLFVDIAFESISKYYKSYELDYACLNEFKNRLK